ncbi:MAG: DUF6326 family protein [Treponema sp.]|nr:DUF6326 family protein [Treponema sp.]
MIYCDIFSFFRPGHIEEIVAGFMGPFPVNQISLMIAGLLMAIPALMIMANLFIKMVAIRWVNIIASIVYTLVNIGNIVGEKWGYYIMYGIIEIIIRRINSNRTAKILYCHAIIVYLIHHRRFHD